jgi:formylmethanofuran dehydrogenase subunit E
MNIGTYSYDEYIQLVTSFHGSAAPGLLIGGFIVDLALKNLPEGEYFDALCETPVCLPDAVQLLTPCTVGNGWLKILDFGRFAVTLYEKNNGEGIRVFLDREKLKNWSEIYCWFMKLKTKKEQDHELLMSQIRQAGHGMLGLERVRVEPAGLERRRMGPVAVCPDCGEAYPVKHGIVCKSCAGESPYVHRAALKSGAPS